jgi:excisionase family DNA binding protein
MNEAEAGEFLGLSNKTVSDYTRSGKIPCVKVGRRTLIGRDRLLEWFKEDQAKLRYLPYGDKIDNRLIKRRTP